MIGTTELLLILGIVIVVFGAQKLPELGAGIGRAIRNFKEEVGKKEGEQLIPLPDQETHKLPPNGR